MATYYYKLLYKWENLETGKTGESSKTLDPVVNPHRLIEDWNKQQPKTWRYTFINYSSTNRVIV